MDVNFKQFMGLETPIKSQADNLFNEVLGEISKTLSAYISPGLIEKGSTIYELMTISQQKTPEINYFWEWMCDSGFSLLKDLDKRLPDTENIKDFLSYRKMVLEMDIASESIDMFLLSITEFFTVAKEFLSAYFETAATIGKFNSEEEIAIQSTQMASTATTKKWDRITSSAPLDAELLLCA